MVKTQGAGGGVVASSDICNVSPSDQIGTLDNILNRLQALETVLAGLLGTNVEAVQLSDISNDLGWIYNVVYLGTEGWTKTPSGTLIPPDGWTGLSGIIDGQSGLYIGGATSRETTLHRYGYYSSTIASGNSQVITMTSVPSALINTTNNGTDYFTAGTDDQGNAGWEANQDMVVKIVVHIDFSNGTGTPTLGGVIGRIRRRVPSTSTVSLVSQSAFYDTSDNVAYVSMTSKALLAAGDFLHVIVYNQTDGGILVDNADFNVSIEWLL